MARLTLFFFGFLVYTAVSALTQTEHPASDTAQAETRIAEFCLSDKRSAKIHRPGSSSTH